MFPQFYLSLTYTNKYPKVGFGLTLISNSRNLLNPPGFDQFKRKLLRNMRKKERLSEISARINIYDQFFNSFGYTCPLTPHLKRTIYSGFPRYNLMVDAHFMAEMCAGILVAVTDYECFDGSLTLDLAKKGEICKGMGDREIMTKKGEIVLRDEKEIVCVLCQGADEKTRIKESTRNVLFYAYAVPGIESSYLEEGLSIAANTLEEFGGGTVEGLRVFES